MAKLTKLVSKKELKSLLGIPYCFAHIARLETAGQFPRRLKLGQCRVAWYVDEVVEWIESRPRSTMAEPSHLHAPQAAWGSGSNRSPFL
jgi:prophage regulatory protein